MLCANYYITPSTYVIFWENVENEIFFEFGPAYLTYLTGKLFKTVAYAYLIRYLRIKKRPICAYESALSAYAKSA